MAEPSVTDVIARQVRHIRTQSRLSGAALAAAMQRQGINWNRTTVAKLETGKRESVTIQEWFALAKALGVAPAWLLADPIGGQMTRITAGNGDAGEAPTNLSPWELFLWVAGKQPADAEPGLWWNRSALPLARIYELASRFDSVRRSLADRAVHEELGDPDLEDRVRLQDEQDRSTLRGVRQTLREIGRSGLIIPAVPDDIAERAKELGIDLVALGT